MSKPKILWHSNASWAPTGYGQQTALVTPRLTDEYEVKVSAFYGLEGAPLQFNEDVKVLPGWGQNFGNEVIPQHAQRFFGDLRGGTLVTLMDVWVLDSPTMAKMNVACWTPIDHEPPPPMVMQFFKNSGAVPIAMTKWGRGMLAEFDPLYCPHAVDTSVYKPLSQAECRDAAGLPKDAFVIGVVGANKGWPSRKCLPEILQAFKVFQQRHDDAILYLHTEPHGKVEGVNLPLLLGTLGIKDGSVLFVDEYRYGFEPYSPQLMAKAYGASDVLLAPSMGEGFGLPVLEANACGIPAIVSDFSAQPEVLGAGWKVDGKRVWTRQNSWQFQPDVEDLIEALNRSYSIPEAGLKQMAELGVEHAAKYDIERVVSDHMLPALKEARGRFGETKPKVAVA